MVRVAAVDLSDSLGPGGDLWELTYTVSGRSFAADEGFSIAFDSALYASLVATPAQPSPDWDVLVLQPDPALPADGLYDALALTAFPTLGVPFVVRAIWLGGPAITPGPGQHFSINQFAPGGAFLGMVEAGVTVPEPATSILLLCAFAAAAFFASRRTRRWSGHRAPRFLSLSLLLVLAAGLSGVRCTGSAPPPPQAFSIAVNQGNYTLTYQQVASQRISRTLFEYTYSADLTNLGATPVTGAQASVVSSAAATTIVDGSLTFGNLAPGQTVPSSDTFAFRQDRTVPFQSSDLSFQITTGSSAGPQPPTGLSALPGDGLVVLRWNPASDPGAAYHVYRSLTSGTGFQRLTPSPLTSLEYSDTGLTNGVSYHYVVTTVVAGSEGPLSPEVHVTPPSLTSSRPVPQGSDRVYAGELFQYQSLVDAGVSPQQAAATTGQKLTPTGDLYVTLLAANGNAQSLVAALQNAGASRIATAGEFATLEISPASLRALAALPGVAGIETPDSGSTKQDLSATPGNSEGVRTMGADDLCALGDGKPGRPKFDGTGVKIGVIDFSFQAVTNLLGLNPHAKLLWCPAGATVSPGGGCLRHDGTDRYNVHSGDHGKAVWAIVKEVAPGADFYFYAPEDMVEYQQAVHDAASVQGVDVMVSALAYYNQDDYDGTSPEAQAVDAAAKQLLFVQAAGNSAQSHIRASFDPDANGFHRWSGFGPVATCFHRIGGHDVPVPCLPVQVSAPKAKVFLEWREWGLPAAQPMTDLQLWVYASDQPGSAYTCGTCFPQALRRRPEEFVGAPVGGGAASTVYVAIQQVAPASRRTPSFQLFFDAVGPVTIPGPADQARTSIDSSFAALPSVITVGATKWNTDDLEISSSHGPAVDGTTGLATVPKPDLTGPSGVSTAFLNSSTTFPGTSAAAPHVGGAAALLKQYCQLRPALCPGTTPADIKQTLFERSFDLVGLHVPPLVPQNPRAAFGRGRVDISPLVAFTGADGAVYVRFPVPEGDATDGLVQIAPQGRNPAISPDGSRIAFEVGSPANSRIEIAQLDVPGFPTQLMDPAISVLGPRFHPAWSPNGVAIAYVERDRFFFQGVALAQGYRLRVWDDLFKFGTTILNTDHNRRDNFSASYPSWSPDGKRIAISLLTPKANSGGSRFAGSIIGTVSAQAVSLPLDPASLQVLSTTVDGLRPRYSRDGTKILYFQSRDFTSGDFPSGVTFFPYRPARNGDLIYQDLKNSPSVGGLIQLFTMGLFPEWSPANDRIVYSRLATEPDLASASHNLFMSWIGPLSPTKGSPLSLRDEVQLTNATDDTSFQTMPAWSTPNGNTANVLSFCR